MRPAKVEQVCEECRSDIRKQLRHITDSTLVNIGIVELDPHAHTFF